MFAFLALMVFLVYLILALSASASPVKLQLVISTTRASRRKNTSSYAEMICATGDTLVNLGLPNDVVSILSIITENEVNLVDTLSALSWFEYSLKATNAISRTRGQMRVARSLLAKEKAYIDKATVEYIRSLKRFQIIMSRTTSDCTVVLGRAIEIAESIRSLVSDIHLGAHVNLDKIELGELLGYTVDVSDAFVDILRAKAQTRLTQWLSGPVDSSFIKCFIKEALVHSFKLVDILTELINRAGRDEKIDVSPQVAALVIHYIFASVTELLFSVGDYSCEVRMQWESFKQLLPPFKYVRASLPKFQQDPESVIESL